MEPHRISPGDEEQSSTDIDDLHYSLQAEQENTQKRTFTSWVNSQLEKHSPPSFVLDLYADVGKGHVLLDLLEVLSGQQLPREKGSNTFQCRSNIGNALAFLKNRSIKLINIHVADIIEGKPSIVLGLIWTIIQHLHIEELARTLAGECSNPSLDSPDVGDTSPTASPPAKRNAAVKERWKMSAKKALLLWAKEQCARHGSIVVADFKSSWRNGLAFLAVVHALRPDLVNMEKAKGRSNRENLEEAFRVAEKALNIPRLLEPEDVDVNNPDEKSIMTYLAQFLQYFKSIPVAEDELQGKVKETLSWLGAQEKTLTKLLDETENASLYEKFQEMLSFMERFNEEEKAFWPVLTRKVTELNEDHLRMREAWGSLTSQISQWKAKLDRLLPPPLDAMESWLQEMEHELAGDLPDSQDHSKAMAILEGKMTSVQSSMECFEQHLETLNSLESRDKAGMPLVPPQKLEEMRRRLSSIRLADFNVLVEYYHLFCTAVLEELTSRLNIWQIKLGTKEAVKSLLSDWHDFIEEKRFLSQLETALNICEKKKNKIVSTSDLGVNPEDANKLFKVVESQVSRCKEYIYNVNETLRKNLSAWTTYTEKYVLLKAWLDEMRKEHPKKLSTAALAAWNSRHGSLNEAGNFLIESSTEEVGATISGELKKLNRKWAKLIKKTQFEMRIHRKQEEEMNVATEDNRDVDSPTKAKPATLGHLVNVPEEPLETPVTFSGNLCSDSLTPEQILWKPAVKQNFEEAHKKLEAFVLRALQLLGSENNPEGPISKYEEAFSILDTSILGEFLKAAEQLKDISSAHEKAAVEEKSRGVRDRWEEVHQEILSYIQLKMEVERGKMNKIFSKLNKQINKEKKLLSAGKTKGLIEEHEATFSHQGSLGELNTCIKAIKTMSEKSEIKIPIAEYEQKKEELQKRATAVYYALAAKTSHGHSPKTGGLLLASPNREKMSSLNHHDGLSAEKDSREVSHVHLELEKKFQNGGDHSEKTGRDEDLPLENLKKSYDTAKRNLKLHLSSIREKSSSALTGDVKDATCLQNKLHELEALENKASSSWKMFEFVASMLEELSGETEISSKQSREELLGEWKELQFALNKRMESLKAALALVLPIENEWALLCGSDEQLCKKEIPRCVLSNSNLPHKKVKKMRVSISNCIEQCSQQSQNVPAGWKVGAVDWQAAAAILGAYKVRLEELGHKMQAIETILQDLEIFLAFLRHAKVSAEVPAPLSQAPPRKEGIVLQEVLQMQKEARSLDERLKRVHIFLEDGESGRKRCCEELVDGLVVAVSSAENQEVNRKQETQEEFGSKNSELYKSIQDIHDKIGKIGLRDPTIPAVQQRLKSLSELRQKLDRHAVDMRSLNEMVTKDQREELKQQLRLTERLWKETKLSVAEMLEHCSRVMELLKQYHSCKNCLASIILKQEHTLSQQVSYMGKENLQRIINKVNMVREEFNSHSEDVDKINQICKNLQSQLNKMKSFEEPPFENEANAIVDRWLDINERTETYCDNLERALALWDSLLNLSSSVDEWSSTQLKNLEEGPVTEEELVELEAGLQFQEKKLEEFDTKVDEIQNLLNGSEPPLELQVIKSSLSNKMELIRKYLPSKLIPAELNGNTAELKGDLDLAKTQIGMTESLLKALSPSDTLEIFTKLEELHQKILQQKHQVESLQKGTGYLNPEVIELKEQLRSVTGLFNSKKQIFQDHFTTLLNYQCKDFDDWFSSAQLSLEECFEPSETKEMLEDKVQRLRSFLTFEGKDHDIREVKALLSQVKGYLPKVTGNRLSSWVKEHEAELQRLTSACQAREKEMCGFLEKFVRLEDDLGSLQEWLSLHELQESPSEKPEHLYQLLLKQRESFDSFAWLTNSLRSSGFTSDEVVLESDELISRYRMLVSRTRKSLGVSRALLAEEKNLKDYVQSMLSWVHSLKASVLELSSEESKMPLEERLCQLKEIVLLKNEGDVKLQNITALGEHLKSARGGKSLAIQQLVADLRDLWESTIHLAADNLKHQEHLQLRKQEAGQRGGDARSGLCESEMQKQELSLDSHPDSQKTQSQLTDSAALLQEAADLRILLKQLGRLHRSLSLSSDDDSSTGESLGALRHFHERLISRLQNTAKLFEGHAEEHQCCRELTLHLRATLEELWHSEDAEPKEVQRDTLCQTENTLQRIIAVVEHVRQKISPLGQICFVEEANAPPTKHKKRLKTGHGPLELEAGNAKSHALDQNHRCSSDRQTKEQADEKMTTDTLFISGIPFGEEEMTVMEVGEGCQKGGSKVKNLSPAHPTSIYQGLKGSLMEAHNLPGSESQNREQLQNSRGVPADDNNLNELRQQQLSYQMKLPVMDGQLEMPLTTLPLMNGKIMGADLAPTSITPPSPENVGLGLEIVYQSSPLQPGDQAVTEYAEMEQKINEMKTWTKELDIVLVNDQLKEIEKLCAQLEIQKAKAVSVWQEQSPEAAERTKLSPSEPHYLAWTNWDRLLQDLTSVKQAKQDQLHLVNNYQDSLTAVQASMKRLSAEKERIRTRGPVEDSVLLGNIKKCLASVQQDRVFLNNLEREQGNLTRHLTRMDRELTQSQVDQVEQWWKQMEESLQRMQLRVTAEAEEFKLFMDKAQSLQSLLQQQRRLRTGLENPSGEDHVPPALMATELQTLKHGISLLQRGAEMRMKRIWGDSEKKALETAINDLQNQVEELEQLTPKEDVQKSGDHPQVSEITKKIKEAILWVKVSMLDLDEKAALFPEELMLQIKSYQALISVAKDKEPVFKGLVHEVQCLAPQLPPNEATAINLLAQELQTSHQYLVRKLIQKMQHLELQLEKRRKLFADMEKMEKQLQKMESVSSLEAGEAIPESELSHWQTVLEKIPEEIQELEGLLEATGRDAPEGLNVFEQMFLNDCLRSLRKQAKRVQRLIQMKGRAIQNKIEICGKFTEKTTSLQQDLSSLQCGGLDIDLKQRLPTDEEVKDKVSALREKVGAAHSSVSHLGKYKEIWEWLDLKWDASQLDELQSQFCKIKDQLDQGLKCIGRLSTESTRHQTTLSAAEAIVSDLQRECKALQDCSDSTSETNLVLEKKLRRRAQHAQRLTQEALRLLDKSDTLDASLKEAKIQEIKSLEAKIDGLTQMIQFKILAVPEKPSLQSKLDHSLRTLKQIQSELQQPLLLDLEIQTIPCEKMYCEVLEDAVEAECCAAEDLINKKRGARMVKPSFPDILGTKLGELQNLKKQLKVNISTRVHAIDEASEIVQRYNEAVQKAVDLLHQQEASLSSSLLSLEELENGGSLLSQQKELEVAKGEVEVLTSTLENKMKPRAKLQMEKTLDNLVARSLILKKKEQKRRSDVKRCLEKYHSFKNSKEVICANLNDVEKVLWKSLHHIPVSYKQALEQSEQSKMLVSQLVSTEEILMKVRQDSGYLSLRCEEKDRELMAVLVSTLWLKWLCLLNVAKEWDGKCEEQNRGWKSISEETERETIILDNLQEELPEGPKEMERATEDELQEFLDCTSHYVESVEAEKLLLRLILHRLRTILMVPESLPEKRESFPVVREIKAMQERMNELCEKAQKQKDAIECEKESRDKINEEINAVKNFLQDNLSLLHNMDLGGLEERAAKLEEIQKAIDTQRQTLEEIMEKLRIKYADMYALVPVEVEMHLEDCKETLQDLEEKVSSELLKNSPHYITNKKIEEINKGLQAIENMLRQKSKDVEKAKEVQKRIWDLLDLWHYKMNELDSDVQDKAEQDPDQAQELLDHLMIPLQQYQHVSQLAERRTTSLNMAAGKMEECAELLKSTRVWLENTNRLLAEECKSDSAKCLNKHASALQMAFEDSEQKQSILSALYSDLEELSSLIETEDMVQELNKVSGEVRALQQKIIDILPHIQHLADEAEAIESEVKTMEKDIDKIKTILSPSEETLELSPKEHLKHCQVILAHINPMQKTLAEINSYKESLRLPGMRTQPLSVFRRTEQLLKELRRLEKITKEQNALLEPIVKEVEKNEEEIDLLKQLQIPKSDLDEWHLETPWSVQDASHTEGEEMDEIKRQIALLCQKKEDILTTMKNSLMELQREEQPELEDEILESEESEESGGDFEWQLRRQGSMSLLPSLVEEAEDSLFQNQEMGGGEPEAVHDTTDSHSPCLLIQNAESDEVLSLSRKSGGKPSTGSTNTASYLGSAPGESKEAADVGRPDSEPAQVLHVCQAQIAELEQWLDRAKESLGSEAQTRQMQQTVEQHLVACQVMLSEIEQKVARLLEDCKGRPASNRPGFQQEAENLSQKLKDVKGNLERVQAMLQDKHVEEQLIPEEKIFEKLPQPLYFDLSSILPRLTSGRPLLNRPNSLQHQQELLFKLSEQSNLVDFIEIYMEEMASQDGDSAVSELQASETPVPGKEPVGLTLKDQTGDKWQYLQEELMIKKNPPHFQLAKPQIATKINILPKGGALSVSTPAVEELKTYTAQLENLSQEASAQIQENVTGDVSLNLDQKLFELFLAISRCLNNMEQMLSTCVLTNEEVRTQQLLFETLSAELQKLHADIGDKKDALLKSITSVGGDPERFSQCFRNLQAWLQVTEAAATSRNNSMKAELDGYSNYQNEIRQLYDELIEKKISLQQSFSATSSHGISQAIQQVDAYEFELQNFETRTAKLRDRGERLHLPTALIHEVDKLEDVLDDLWEILRVKQRQLTSPFIEEQQYEALLKGLSELVELGREKIDQVSELKTTSRPNLQVLLQNHKNFFRNLGTHARLVQMCSQKVAPSVLEKRKESYQGIAKDISSLEQQAVQQGARLESLLQDWIEFDDSYMSFCQKLEALSSTVSSVSLVTETEEKLMERTQLFQQIRRNIEDEQARYHQVLKEGKSLMELVSCPELQSQVGKLEEQWTSLSKKVDQELQRLETFLKLLSSYNKESKELDNWLTSAQQRVNDWKVQSLGDFQDLNAVTDHIRGLLEFSKEVDSKSSLKSSVINTGHQLLLVKESDAAALRSFLADYEQKWADLIAQLPSIQEKFHKLQMEKLPSDEAITEVTIWMTHIEEQSETEAAVSFQTPTCQVKRLLAKYKEYLMEMNFKQWTVDFVNQSLLQVTTSDVESKRYERTAFAERLGEMNLKWHKLQAFLNGKIKELENILESVAEKESKAQALGWWLEAESERLARRARNPTSSIPTQDAAGDCKVLENQLAVKSKEMDQLKENCTASDGHSETSEEIVLKISDLYEMRTKLINQAAELKTSIQAALGLWKIYDEAWGEVRLMLASTSYSMDLCKPAVFTPETLKKQVENLQSLQDKAENNEEIWARLQTAGDNLKKLCDPLFTELVEQKHKEAHTRWMLLNTEMKDQLQKAQNHLGLWESYVDLCTEVTAKLDKHEEECNSLLMANRPTSCTTDLLKQKIQDVKKLQVDLQNIQAGFSQVSELADKITQLTEPTALPLVREKLQPLQRVSRLGKMLQLKEKELQLGVLQLEGFENCLEKLENHIKTSEETQGNLSQEEKDSNLLMSQFLGLVALSPEMESVNEVSLRLLLSDFTAKRLQSLNWQWSQKTAMLLEQCSELQDIKSDDRTFCQRCQTWVQFLERTKEALKENVAGTLEELQEQHREYEILQAEISVNQQVFNAIVSKALHMAEEGEAGNRAEFISKLTRLKEQWQNIILRAQKRKSEIDGLVKLWQKFTASLQDLTKFLTDTNIFIVVMKNQDKNSLHQVRNLSHDFKNKQVLLQRWRTRYSLTLETGRKILDVASPAAKTAIELQINQLQECWDTTQIQVEKIAKQFQDTIQTWESCKKCVEELSGGLQELKAKIKDPLPIMHDMLQASKEDVEELEKTLASWNQTAKELGTRKADLARYLLAEDVMVLKEQVQHLHTQWEELCLRVSLRKQEIEDRLNAWIVFNEKNKELCTWLVQMESKVLQSADISIEDMIDKLQKDCMEEINLFSENKLVHFKQMGDQLMKASNKKRVAEIDEKLNKINDRWQHLFDVIGGRVKKLKETFAFIQQLDKNMSNLRTWLARIESELSKPVVYDICDNQEIQKRLAEQQDLQRDIEQHSAGVESVFNICEVLLHDSDACANETECDSIQQTTRSLDRRWRNICAMSVERRMKIEETWRLWQRFLDDYSRFEDWLKTAERTAASPNSSEVSYVNAKEELKKFDAFQRQIHERLTQLELINKQYRRLARENRTDSASKLKQMVHEGNQRWDNLQRRVTAILRRLKHFASQWEEFMTTKDCILVWLTEMDLQLTNVEHFSESNFEDKLRQLNGFQQEIMLNTNKIDHLILFGEHLIQKSEPSDAVIIEEELEELNRYCQEVFGRVSRFYQKLASWHPGLEDERETSENEAEMEEGRAVPWHKKAMHEMPPSQQSLCHLMPPAVGQERSGCETPVSVDSIPLEWDHTGDVGGSSSPEDEEEEPYFSALSDLEIPDHPEAYLKMTTKTLKAASGKSVTETHTWHSPESSTCRKSPYKQEEMIRDVLSGSLETSTPYKPGYAKQLSTDSIDSVKEISAVSPTKESQDSQDFVGVAAMEKQPGAVERWELIQAQDLSNKLRMKQNLQQWQQLNSDLANVNAWLDTVEEELEELQEEEPPTSILAIEQRVKKLKDMLKAFDNYKALVLSINLTSKDFKQADSTGSKELQNRLRRVNLRWEKANLLIGNWKKSLQEALMDCQDFHELNQKLLLWLACTETRRHHAQVKGLNADPHTIQESWKELMQLEKELLERQLQVNTLQEISTYLLAKSDGGEYVEAKEKVHVIGKKLKQLLEGVSRDLKVSRRSQDISVFQPQGDERDSGNYHQLPEKPSLYKHKVDGREALESENGSRIRAEKRDEVCAASPSAPSFFYRVLRVALPLQLLFLLLLFLASLVPCSEDDYSCAQTNNFARSFYPMLRYTNGPPPT
uniref:Nesprin-2 isoform X3 n=1 Tax=Pogona vitticeps TaxID=103695 RepID=A0ABM5FBV7_9SAUR